MSKTSRRKLTFDAKDEITVLFKSNSDHPIFQEIQEKYNVELKVNAVGILVAKGEKDKTLELETKFKSLRATKKAITTDDIRNILDEKEVAETIEEVNLIELEFKDRGGRTSLIKPRTPHQKEFMEKIIASKVILGMGSAGTGKSFLAVAMALKMLEAKRIAKIIISRPAVETGKSIGFLPGTADEKMAAYLMPIFAILEEIIGKERRDKMIADGKIEILPIGYARGLTIGNQYGVVAIIDEAQNLEFTEHKLLLTRLGAHPNSKLIFCGDQRQSDLKHAKDTLSTIHNIIKDSKFVASVVFDKNDIVRSEAVKDILGRIEDYEDKKHQ